MANEGRRYRADDLFTCSICYEKLDRAKILNCLHSFCQLCLERHYGLGMPRCKIKRYKVISCPNCRELTVMSRGVDGLPEDSSLVKMSLLVNKINDLLTENSEEKTEREELDNLQSSIREKMSMIHEKMLKLAEVELKNLAERPRVLLRPKTKKVRVVEKAEYNPLLAKLKRIQDTLYVANSNLKSYASITDDALLKLKPEEMSKILEKWRKIGEEILEEQSLRITNCDEIYEVLISEKDDKKHELCKYDKVRYKQVWRIGQRGSSPGMFDWPVDVAFDKNRILVADKNNRRVQIFDMAGQFIKSMGKNELAPKRIVVKGTEYHVSDEVGLCVKVLKDDTISQTWGDGQFTSPCGFAIDTDEDFIMSDAELGLVSVFNSRFLPTTVFKTRAPTDYSVPNPYFLTTNKDDQIIVSDSYNNCLKIFAKTGQLLLTFGHDILKCPRGVCTDSDDNILVVDSDNHKVRVFDGFGQFLSDILTVSDGLHYPMGIDVRDSHVVLTQCGFYGGHEVRLFKL